jgi:hypothetical protein
MSWERFILRTDEALEQLDRELRDLAPRSDEPGAEQDSGWSVNDGPMGLRSSPDQAPDDQGQKPNDETSTDRRAQVIDEALESLCGRLDAIYLVVNHIKINIEGFTHRTPEERIDASASLAFATIAGGWVYVGSANRKDEARRRRPVVHRWQDVRWHPRSAD